MIKINAIFLIIRNTSCTKNVFLHPPTCSTTFILKKSTKTGHSSSSSSSSSDNDESTQSGAKSKDEKLNKLNDLLKQLVNNDKVAKPFNLDLAKPTNKRIKREAAQESVKTETVEQSLVKAVKDVADEVGGDTKQTESELLMKLLNTETSPECSKNLSDIVKGMKIDRDSKPVEITRADQVRSILKNVKGPSGQEHSSFQNKPRISSTMKYKKPMVIEKIDLFGSEPLGIFTDKSKLKASKENKTWEVLHARDLKLAVTHPPANYFQQMILWTEQGKLWKFPIDNEQGLDEEKKVYFAKHIFLEEHLEPWCPSKGPLRHFMELVCVGLSKNPYLTVEAKIEHIEWYKNYFESKRTLLEQVGAFPEPHTPQKTIE